METDTSIPPADASWYERERCPFCGKPPKIVKSDDYPRDGVTCSNELCPVSTIVFQSDHHQSRPHVPCWGDRTPARLETHDRIAELVKKLKDVTRWIPLEERKPKPGTCVILGRGKLSDPATFQANLVCSLQEGDYFLASWSHWYPVEEPRP